MSIQVPPQGFSCGMLHINNTCLCDNAPCHFPGNVLDCFLKKERLKAVGHPRRVNEYAPHIVPPPSIAAGKEKLKIMMRPKPPKA